MRLAQRQAVPRRSMRLAQRQAVPRRYAVGAFLRMNLPMSGPPHKMGASSEMATGLRS
jgi:hypothetical protein